MEYTREIVEKALECCDDCSNCPLSAACENKETKAIMHQVVTFVNDLKATLTELDEFAENAVETQTQMNQVITNLSVERDAYREAFTGYKNYIENFGNYLNAGYEPTAAKYAAEMDMWRVIALDNQAKDEELERLSAENLELRSKINVSDN